MDYVLAIVTAFSESDVKEATVKARGRSITTAVDAVEIARRKFVKEMIVDKVAIGTEEMPPKGRRKQLKKYFNNRNHLKTKLAHNIISKVSTA